MTPASLIGTYNVADRNTRNNLEISVTGFKATSPKSPPHAMALLDKPKAVQGVVFLRGSASRPGKKVPRQYLSILSDGPPKEFTQGSGRLDLANAIASPTNPLTARVTANRHLDPPSSASRSSRRRATSASARPHPRIPPSSTTWQARSSATAGR
jgi:hypothetical protein